MRHVPWALLAVLVTLGAAPAKAPSADAGTAPATRPAFAEKGGVVVIEAEHFTGRAQGTEMTDHDWTVVKSEKASGGAVVEATPNNGAGVMDRTTAPRLDYAVDFATPGTYFVWLRMTGPSGEDDSVHAGLDGRAATFGGLGMCHSAYGRLEWVNAVWDRSGPVTVEVGQAGRHTFQLWMREDGVQVDKIVLIREPAVSPNGEGPRESGPSAR